MNEGGYMKFLSFLTVFFCICLLCCHAEELATFKLNTVCLPGDIWYSMAGKCFFRESIKKNLLSFSKEECILSGNLKLEKQGKKLELTLSEFVIQNNAFVFHDNLMRKIYKGLVKSEGKVLLIKDVAKNEDGKKYFVQSYKVLLCCQFILLDCATVSHAFAWIVNLKYNYSKNEISLDSFQIERILESQTSVN